MAESGSPRPITPCLPSAAGTLTYPPARRNRMPSADCQTMGADITASEAGKGIEVTTEPSGT